VAAQIAARIVGVSKGKGSGTNTASQATGSITPVSGELMLVWVASTRAGASNTPTMTGTNGLSVTWTAVANIQDSGNTEKLTLFRGVPSSSVAGVLTIAFAAQTQLTVSWLIVSYPSVNQATTQGVVQSITGTANAATVKALALAAAQGNNANVVAYGGYSSANTTFTAEAGCTAVDTQADAQGTIGVEGTSPATLPPDVTPDGGTFGASGTLCAIAVEIKALYALDVRPTGSGLKPGTATAHVTQSGSRRFRGVTSTGGDFGGRPSFGSPGPSGYPVGDPAGLTAVAVPVGASSVGYWPFRSQRDDAVGNPTGPSQRQIGKGGLGLVVAALAGSNTWTIDVKFEAGNGPYPRFRVKADPTLGLYADVIVTAAAPASIDTRSGISGSTEGFRKGGYAWQTLTLVFTLAVAGAVELVREKQTPGMDLVWWDKLTPA
jgi:hypothetical protein